jgi:hypothetical protein
MSARYAGLAIRFIVVAVFAVVGLVLLRQAETHNRHPVAVAGWGKLVIVDGLLPPRYLSEREYSPDEGIVLWADCGTLTSEASQVQIGDWDSVRVVYGRWPDTVIARERGMINYTLYLDSLARGAVSVEGIEEDAPLRLGGYDERAPYAGGVKLLTWARSVAVQLEPTPQGQNLLSISADQQNSDPDSAVNSSTGWYEFVSDGPVLIYVLDAVAGLTEGVPDDRFPHHVEYVEVYPSGNGVHVGVSQLCDPGLGWTFAPSQPVSVTGLRPKTVLLLLDSGKAAVSTQVRPAPTRFEMPTTVLARGDFDLTLQKAGDALRFNLTGVASSVRYTAGIVRDYARARDLGVELIPPVLESRRDTFLAIAGILIIVSQLLRFIWDLFKR